MKISTCAGFKRIFWSQRRVWELLGWRNRVTAIGPGAAMNGRTYCWRIAECVNHKRLYRVYGSQFGNYLLSFVQSTITTSRVTLNCAMDIRKRRKRSKSTRSFVNRNGNPPNICSENCKTSPKECRQNSTPNFTSCARPAQAVGTSQASSPDGHAQTGV